MRVSIFSCINQNRSQDRYASELSRNFPPGIEVHKVWFAKAAGLRGAVLDHYFKYLRVARHEQGDGNIIASAFYSYLLRVLDPERTIVVCHDLHPLLYPEPEGLRHRLHRMRFRHHLRDMSRARWIVTVSQRTKDDLLRFCPFIAPEKVVPLYNGLETHWGRVEDTAALAEVRRKYGLDGKRVLLHVGNDVWYKNFATVLRSFARLSSADAVLVHAGSLRPENRRLAEQLGVARRFVQCDAVTDDDLVLLYNVAEALIFPSLYEGFGWPPAEAMKCGCPVVASDRGSLKEVCGDACLYVDAADVEGIAAAVERVMGQAELRAGLIARGLAQSRKFDWKNTAAGMLQLLQSGVSADQRRAGTHGG